MYGGQSFGVRFLPQQSRRISRISNTTPKMHMSAVEPVVSLLLAADGAQSLRYSGGQRAALVNTAVDANTCVHSIVCLPRTTGSTRTHTISALH